MTEEKGFTLEELARFDGKNGHRAYIAFRGKVYDVTDSALWQDGEHIPNHTAGHDLSGEMDEAPHGPENLERMTLVGVLAG